MFLCISVALFPRSGFFVYRALRRAPAAALRLPRTILTSRCSKEFTIFWSFSQSYIVCRISFEFVNKILVQDHGLAFFFVARVPRRDLSLLWGFHVLYQFCNVVDHGAALTGLHFGRHLDANLGGARSQRSMGFSNCDTKKHVRETPKNQTCTGRCPAPVTHSREGSSGVRP